LHAARDNSSVIPNLKPIEAHMSLLHGGPARCKSCGSIAQVICRAECSRQLGRAYSVLDGVLRQPTGMGPCSISLVMAMAELIFFLAQCLEPPIDRLVGFLRVQIIWIVAGPRCSERAEPHSTGPGGPTRRPTRGIPRGNPELIQLCASDEWISHP
jgi:hypothetical protein